MCCSSSGLEEKARFVQLLVMHGCYNVHLEPYGGGQLLNLAAQGDEDQ
jgi:hypothetical protein